MTIKGFHPVQPWHHFPRGCRGTRTFPPPRPARHIGKYTDPHRASADACLRRPLPCAVGRAPAPPARAARRPSPERHRTRPPDRRGRGSPPPLGRALALAAVTGGGDWRQVRPRPPGVGGIGGGSGGWIGGVDRGAVSGASAAGRAAAPSGAAAKRPGRQDAPARSPCLKALESARAFPTFVAGSGAMKAAATGNSWWRYP